MYSALISQAYGSEYTVNKWFHHIITIIAVGTTVLVLIFYWSDSRYSYCKDTRVPQIDSHCPNTEQIVCALFYS